MLSFAFALVGKISHSSRITCDLFRFVTHWQKAGALPVSIRIRDVGSHDVGIADVEIRRFGSFSEIAETGTANADVAGTIRAVRFPSGERRFSHYSWLRNSGPAIGSRRKIWHANIALNRHVAIKVVEATVHSPRTRRSVRFQREAEAVAYAATSEHHSIFGLGTERGDKPNSVYCSGAARGALAIHTGKPIARRAAAELIATLADAMQCAHERGIVHRDLKPSNVLMNVVSATVKTSADPLSCLTPKITGCKRLETVRPGDPPDSRTIAGSTTTPGIHGPGTMHGRSDILVRPPTYTRLESSCTNS